MAKSNHQELGHVFDSIPNILPNLAQPVDKALISPSASQPLDEFFETKGWAQRVDGRLRLTDSQTFWEIIDYVVSELATIGYFPTPIWFHHYLHGTKPDTALDSWFEARPYRIRQARATDLPALLHLEDVCWAEPLRASSAELQQRIDSYPQCHFVLTIEEQVVGVIYSQQIEDVEALAQTNFRTVSALHTRQGSIVQLLAVNLLPAPRYQGLGDQLLEFRLQYATLQRAITGVVAVTLCKQFASHAAQRPLSMEDYIRLRNQRGQLVDPILQFHEAHGAHIRRVLDGYRPPDQDNQGKGILVEYDLKNRLTDRATSLRLAEDTTRASTPLPSQTMAALVDDAVCTILGPARTGAFARKRPLMEMGFESFELLELRTLLSQRLGVALDPTFFFRYSTADAILAYFQHGAQATTPAISTLGADHYTLDRLDEPVSSRAIGAGQADPRQDKLQNEPIAIIGTACRFPGGVTNPDEFWSLLYAGVDAITEVPKTRWDMDAYHGDQPGQIITRYGGFLDQVDQFDAAFFRVAPVEASAMDPQQRLLLETHWEALENAGIAPDSLKESATGIFVGIFADDYKLLQAKQPGPLSTYFGTGTANSVAAGRIAYFLGLQGPTVAVDTACSSSLVAVHFACQSLQSGQSNLALASGVNLLLSPELSITFSQANMLAPDGRCKTFDAAADGYVRSEGCGVVVLKRLGDALAAGDNVLAVIRGSAINQDGASNGLTAPNGLAQEDMLRKALASAKLAPHEISYVEAHGTGTPLGDPIEIRALETVYGAGRSTGQPLLVGSVKTNIGHTEAAAGIAGLMKVVLALQNRYIPPHLHFQMLNPHLGASQVRIPAQGQAWAVPADQPRRAGVSSFGFSGTNAHVILEEAPNRQTAQKRLWRPYHLLTLSAQSEDALSALIQQVAAGLPAYTDGDFADICYTTNVEHPHFDYRYAVAATTLAQLGASLREATEQQADRERLQTKRQPLPKIAFLFAGQGSQYVNMGRELYATQPVFRHALERCDTLLQAHLGKSLLAILYPPNRVARADRNGSDPHLLPPSEDHIDQTAYTQPALFALEYALAELWKSWGIEPDIVIGHSVGELVAACVAGVFSLEDGLKLIAARGQLMQALPQDGTMVALRADEAQVQAAIAPFHKDVAIAAVNGPQSVVISGQRQAVQTITKQVEDAGVKTHQLVVSHAFHSPLMEPMLAEFQRVANTITYAAPKLALIANVTGQLATNEITTPNYWVRHVREAVRFADGIQSLNKAGAILLIEIGPDATLLKMAERCLAPTALVGSASLQPGVSDWQQLLTSVGMLYTHQLEVDWARVNDGYALGKVTLPKVPLALATEPAQDHALQSARSSAWHLLHLSAKTEPALHSLAKRYHHFLLTYDEIALHDVCYTAHSGRSQLEHRLSVAARSKTEVLTKLAALTNGGTPPGLSQGYAAEQKATPKLAFLFTGQGSQYLQMGRTLYETQPVFRRVLNQCDIVWRDCLGRSLRELLYPPSQPLHNDLMESHPCGQAVNFAIECALVELWRSWGITPDLVLGHSLGDVAAAYTAGVLSLADGLRLVTGRGRLMETAHGSMLAVLAGEAEVAPFVAAYANVTIGVINGPKSVVISGAEEAVAIINEQLQAAGFKTRRLAIPVAAHSPLLDPVLDQFEAAVQRVVLSTPKVPVISSMTGARVSTELTDPGYWRQHLRNPVRFADGVTTLYAQGTTILLEIGPKPTLLSLAQAVFDDGLALNATLAAPVMLPSLREGRDDWQQMLESLGALYVRGLTIDWQAIDQGYHRQKVSLPTYPFQRQRYWFNDASKQAQVRKTLRPLIERQIALPSFNATLFETEFSTEVLPFLADYRVYGTMVVPAACQLAMVLSAAELKLGGQQIQMETVTLPQPLVMTAQRACTVQVVLTPVVNADSNPKTKFEVISFDQQADDGYSLTHATGYLTARFAQQPYMVNLAILRQRCAQSWSNAAFYTQLTKRELALGPSFRWVDEVWQNSNSATGEALGKLQLPADAGRGSGYLLHPGLLDACFQVAGMAAAMPVGATDQATAPLLPLALTALRLYASPHLAAAGQGWWCHALQIGEQQWDIRLLDHDGQLLAEIDGYTVGAVALGAIQPPVPGATQPMMPLPVSLRQSLDAAPEAQRKQLLVHHLRGLTAKVLGVQTADEIATEQGWMAIGLDSLMSVELRNQLSRMLAHPFPTTLLFDYPTINALTRYIEQTVLHPIFAEPAFNDEIQTEAMTPTPAFFDDTTQDTAMSDNELALWLDAEIEKVIG